MWDQVGVDDLLTGNGLPSLTHWILRTAIGLLGASQTLVLRLT